MDVIANTSSNSADDDLWGPESGMEVENSSSSELSPPIPENSLAAKLNGLKNITPEEYIQLLEQHSAENPSDMDAVSRLIAALTIELEKEDAKSLMLKKIYISQNPSASGSQINSSTNSVTPGSYSSTAPAKSTTPMTTTAQQNGSVSNSEIQRRQHQPQQQLTNPNRRQQTTSAMPYSVALPASPHNLIQNATQPLASGVTSSVSAHSNLPANTSSHVNSTPTPVLPPEPVSIPLPPLPKLASNVAMQNLEQQTLVKRNELRRSAEEAMIAVPLPNPNAPIGAKTNRFGWGDTITFVPNALSPEFVYLYGLEEVVNKIQEYDLIAAGQPVSSGCNYPPFLCCECGTDFTPQWKRKVDVMAQNCITKNGESISTTLSECSATEVMCEACVSAVQRQRLRQEYTKKIRDVSLEELVKEKEIEGEFKRIRSTPSEFEKYRSEQEKKLQAQHIATYGNRGLTGTVAASGINSGQTAVGGSGVHSNNSLISTSVNGGHGHALSNANNNNVVGLQQNTANATRRNPVLSSMQQPINQTQQQTSSQQRQVNQTSSQISNVYGLNPRPSTTPRTQSVNVSQNTISSNAAASARRSSNYTGNGTSTNSNVVGLNSRSATNPVYSTQNSIGHTNQATLNQRSSTSTTRMNPQQNIISNLNLTTNSQAQSLPQSSTGTAGASSQNAPVDINLINGSLPADLQFLLIQSLLAQNPMAALLVHNLQQQQQQQQQLQQQARPNANASTINPQNLSNFINLCLQQQAQPQNKGGHHK